MKIGKFQKGVILLLTNKGQGLTWILGQVRPSLPLMVGYDLTILLSTQKYHFMSNWFETSLEEGWNVKNKVSGIFSVTTCLTFSW